VRNRLTFTGAREWSPEALDSGPLGRQRPDISRILATFPREVPVFPLAGVVLFPGAVLPLHVFEPRYRRMLADAQAEDGLIAAALLKDCDAGEYERAPPFHETVCVGHVLHAESLPDGRSNIALLGLSAARAYAAPSTRPYRTARVELLPERPEPGRDFDRRLATAFGRTSTSSAGITDLRDRLAEILPSEKLPSALVNTCALTAPLFPMDKLTLLEERSLDRRLDRLLELLTRPWQWN